MAVRGKVKNGKVVLDDPKALPEGAEVEVRPVKNGKQPAKSSQGGKRRRRSLAERLAPFIGKAEGLPPDASVYLDHYLYGLPKPE